MNFGIDNDFPDFNVAFLPCNVFSLPTRQSNTPREREEQYQNFDGKNRYHEPAFAPVQQDFQHDLTQLVVQPQAQPHPQHGDITSSSIQPNRHSIASLTDPSLDMSQDYVEVEVFLQDQQSASRSSSEVRDNRTSKENKRKAQNRAHQRTCRERKETYVEQLEDCNTTLQHERVSLQNEVKHLHREVCHVNSEDNTLRATSGSSSIKFDSLFDAGRAELGNGNLTPGPLGYTAADYVNRLRVVQDETTEWSSNTRSAQAGSVLAVVVGEEHGEASCNIGQTWEYIEGHGLFKRGRAEVGDVCERLGKMIRCDG